MKWIINKNVFYYSQMELSDLSYNTEEVIDLIHRFICFAYDEFQTNGWQQRRIDIRRQYKILDYNGSSNDKEEYLEMIKNYLKQTESGETK